MDEPEFVQATQIVRGPDALREVPAIVTGIAFVVTDKGIADAGHVDRLLGVFAAAGRTAVVYDAVTPNPDEDAVAACLEAYRQAGGDEGFDWIVALGGGSAIDVAKGCAMLACSGGRMADYLGRGRIDVQRPRLLAVPTTAGTGSETQSFALIGNRDTGQKMACGGTAPAFAVLDAALTVTMPEGVTACTGLDTLTHAVEASVTKRRSPASRARAIEAFQLVERHFEAVLDAPNDLDARAAMLHASALAGLAIENGMLGAAHSMANPLTRRFGVAHGQAVGQALPGVVAYNAVQPDARAGYADLARTAGLARTDDDDRVATEALQRRLRALVTRAGFGVRLEGVPAMAADELAQEAATQWTAQFNPRDVDAAAFGELFRGLLA